MSLNPQSLRNGQAAHESFPHPFKKGKRLVQYDYRHWDGELFSCVAKDIIEAQAKRDAWLARREEKGTA